jgi:phosphate-selective porin OprO/OprP
MSHDPSFRLAVAFSAVVVLVAAASAAAQGTSRPPGSADVQGGPAPAPAAVRFQDGLLVETPDRDYRLLVGLVVQTDGYFSAGDPSPITNTFSIRKMRPTFSGRVARYFDFKVMPDFGSGQARLMDAYFDVRFSPRFRIRAGKDKTPVGYELLQGDAFLLFPERSLATNLVPNRDVGIAAQGDLGPKFFYAAGVFNGVPDGASSSSDPDTNDGKDLAGRVVVHPFRSAGTGAGDRLTGLGFQIGGSVGRQSGALPVFRTSVGQTYFAYAPGTAADGTRTRVSPALFYYYRALGVFGEYMRTTQRITRADVVADAVHDGWEVTGSYVLTGEAASERGVRPRRPFSPPSGDWGALQAIARYSRVELDSRVFPLALAAAGMADAATSFTVGLNWYPATVFKYYLTFERTTFEPGEGPERADENVIVFRLQLGI